METKFLALSLSFLVLSFTTIGAHSHGPVLDVEGNPLQLGTAYYVAPAIWALGGGVALPPRFVDPFCQKGVTVVAVVQQGTPVIFSLADEKVSGVVNDTSDVEIRFTEVRSCDDSSLWKIDEKTFVTVGGTEGEHNTIFNIEPATSYGSGAYFLKPANSNNLSVGFGWFSRTDLTLTSQGLPFVFKDARPWMSGLKDKLIRMPQQP